MSVWDDPHEKLQLHLSPHTDTLALVQSDGGRSVMGIPGQIGLYLSYVIAPQSTLK
jgi:hypothetical protein